MQACGGNSRRAFRRQLRMRSRFHVAKEMRTATAAPVRRVIRLHPETGAKRTIKGMLRRADHDPSVPNPHDEVPWLWPVDSPEFLDSSIQIRRTLVLVRETSLLVDRVDQVRAVRTSLGFVAAFERGTEDRKSIIGTDQLCRIGVGGNAWRPLRSRCGLNRLGLRGQHCGAYYQDQTAAKEARPHRLL